MSSKKMNTHSVAEIANDIVFKNEDVVETDIDVEYDVEFDDSSIKDSDSDSATETEEECGNDEGFDGADVTFKSGNKFENKPSGSKKQVSVDDIPDISTINIGDDDSDNEVEMESLDIGKNVLKKNNSVAKNSGLNKKIKKTPSTAVKQTKNALYSKTNNCEKNFQILIEKLKISKSEKNNVYSINDLEAFQKKSTFPTWLSCKRIKLSEPINPVLIVTDDDSIELDLKTKINLNIVQNTTKKTVIFVKLDTYNAYNKIFFDLIDNILNFNTLQSFMSLLLVAETVILVSKFKSSDYLIYSIAKKLNVEDKLIFSDQNLVLDNIDMKQSNKVKEEIKDIKTDVNDFISFLKQNNLPETLKDKIILEIFKIFNFKTQVKFESFDGLTKLILKLVRKNKLYKKGFTFLTLINHLVEEYPMIPEKTILNHYSKILSNFNKNSQLPLFEYSNTKITTKSHVKINEAVFKKLLSLTVIVEKVYCEFWSCLIPFQLFHGTDFFALDLKVVLDYFIKNDTFKIMNDNENKFYKHVNKSWIVEKNKTYQLELFGDEDNKNILKHFDPTMTKEEFYFKLTNKKISYSVKNDVIVFDDVKKASKYLKFQKDKSNTIFNFNKIIVIGTEHPKINHYENLILYYNNFIQFNSKLFTKYMIQYLITKIKNKETIENLKEMYKKAHSTNIINQSNYMSTYDIENDIGTFKFVTDFFDIDEDFEEYDITECNNYIKTQIKKVYLNFISN